jgi:hypothetical protein
MKPTPLVLDLVLIVLIGIIVAMLAIRSLDAPHSDARPISVTKRLPNDPYDGWFHWYIVYIKHQQTKTWCWEKSTYREEWNINTKRKELGWYDERLEPVDGVEYWLPVPSPDGTPTRPLPNPIILAPPKHAE